MRHMDPSVGRGSALTFLGRLHPYPAMVAESLAKELAERHVPPGSRVLDPFCGSGRMLAASPHAGLRAGLDVNPLAWLLTSAKLECVSPDAVLAVAKDLGRAKYAIGRGEEIDLGDRRVQWFSDATLYELGRIVGWINTLGLRRPDLLLVAAALSATVRDVSFARQVGWKLHRLARFDRDVLSTCPWARLADRLLYCADQVGGMKPSTGDRAVHLGRAADLDDVMHPVRSLGPFDVVLTSPPYGDSRTTVQYGAASALLLSVVSRIDGLRHLASTGGAIDRSCLGGVADPSLPPRMDLRPYWAGGRDTPLARSMRRFLADYARACRSIASSVAPKGKIVMVVGRRSSGGFRLRLDDFTRDRLADLGYDLVERSERKLVGKAVHRRVNRFGASNCAETRAKGLVNTIASEVILTFVHGHVSNAAEDQMHRVRDERDSSPRGGNSML